MDAQGGRIRPTRWADAQGGRDGRTHSADEMGGRTRYYSPFLYFQQNIKIFFIYGVHPSRPPNASAHQGVWGVEPPYLKSPAIEGDIADIMAAFVAAGITGIPGMDAISIGARFVVAVLGWVPVAAVLGWAPVFA